MKYYLTLILSVLSFTTFAQDDLLDMLNSEETESAPERIAYTFKASKLINANTIETTKKKTLDFRITHRFGDMQIGESIGKHTVWGLDNASNIRFSFDYGLTDNLSLGIGRSKTNEHIDMNLKFKFLHQKEKGMPISAAYYTNAAISPVEIIADDDFANRWSYVHQLIIASKITRGISLEILPTLVHRNYVTNDVNPENGSVDENDLFALGFGGRFKVSKRVSFVMDYFLPFSEFRTSSNDYYHSLGLGVEIETGGHVFHINVTNSAGIIENDFLPYTRSNWGDGEYKLGFNISRVFSF